MNLPYRDSLKSSLLTAAVSVAGVVFLVASIMALTPQTTSAVGVAYYVSTTGNDAGTGMADDPFLTIGQGVTAAGVGDTVYVSAGTYTENVTLKNGVILQGLGATIQSAGGTAVIASAVDATTKIDGFTITGTTIDNGNMGGGIYCSGASPIISNNTITGTTIDNGSSGGGIFCLNGATPTISNNTITGTTIRNGSSGAGIYCNNSSPTISNNIISGHAVSIGSSGGGIYCNTSASPTIQNNIINENTVDNASSGGGIYCNTSASPRIINNTITGSTITNASSGGGIYSLGNASPSIFNCIVWGNGDDLNGCTAAYSDIENGDAGEGNISAIPLFVTPGNDFNLLSGSPCIDVGTPSYLGVDAPAFDILGTTRPQGTGFDMGAYEYTAPIEQPRTLPYTGR